MNQLFMGQTTSQKPLWAGYLTLTAWWMVQKRFYKASLSWSRKTEQESLQMFNSHHFFLCSASRHPTAAVLCRCSTAPGVFRWMSGWLPTSQVLLVLRFKKETQFSTNDTPHAKANTDFRSPTCIFTENIHSTVHLTLNFNLSNHPPSHPPYPQPFNYGSFIQRFLMLFQKNGSEKVGRVVWGTLHSPTEQSESLNCPCTCITGKVQGRRQVA